MKVGGLAVAKTIANFITSFLTTFFTKWLEDFLILTGIGLGVVNTYLITVIQPNILVGNYVLSAVLILIGFVVARR